jgi:TetR/AcrR family transcriptional regulator, transcriptional repressor for nem operon
MPLDHSPTKQHILTSGERLIARKGFVGVGLAEILAEAGVPKGSFYHYFGSKERFGEELLNAYVAQYLVRLDAVLAPDGGPARERLLRYFEDWRQSQCDGPTEACTSDAAGSKCLIVKLSAEVADISEAMRAALREGADQVVLRLGNCLHAAQADGSVAADLDAPATALSLYQLWLGASLLAKLRREPSPFDNALSSSHRLLGPVPAP